MLLPNHVQVNIVPAPVIGAAGLTVGPNHQPILVGGCPLQVFLATQLIANGEMSVPTAYDIVEEILGEFDRRFMSQKGTQ